MAVATPLRVGVITPPMVGPLKRYIEYSLHYLPVHVGRAIEPVFFTKTVTASTFDAFAQQIKNGNFDLLWGVTLVPSIHLQRLRDEYDIQTPMLVCSEMNMEGSHQPKNFNILRLPDDSKVTVDVLSTYCASLKKIIISGRSLMLSVSPLIIGIKQRFERMGVKVVYLATDKESAPYDTFMQTTGRAAQLLFLSPDGVGLNQTPALIDVARRFNCSIFSSEQSALRFGIDGTIGFSVEVIGQETAHGLADTLLGKPSFAHTFKSTQHISLPATSHLKINRVADIIKMLPPTHQLLILPADQSGLVAHDISPLVYHSTEKEKV